MVTFALFSFELVPIQVLSRIVGSTVFRLFLVSFATITLPVFSDVATDYGRFGPLPYVS